MFRKSTTSLRVLVTGAAGFLGARVVEAMHLSGFATPVPTIRHWTRAARIARFGSDVFDEIVLCDILDPKQVKEAVADVDAIVHCASSGDREVIVNGTRNLLEAASKRRLRRFVYLSTAEVYGANVSGIIDEDTPTPTDSGRLYGDAKAEAEQLCRSYLSRGVAATILRPSLIYGPFGKSWTADIAKRLQSGKWGRFDDFGEGLANLVYVDDLVDAIRLSLSREEAAGETFNVNGPDRLTWNDYFEQFNAALELPTLPRISAGESRRRTFVMDRVGQLSNLVRSRFEDKLMEIYLRKGWAGDLMKRLKARLDATPSGGELNELFSRSAIYDDARIRHKLGYSPKFHIEDGLRMSIAWLRHHELVQGPSTRTGDQPRSSMQEALP